VRADLCARAGRPDEARAELEAALACTDNRPERELLARKLAALPGRCGGV
jgi:predicted RNA polymerase sigma factor